MVSSVKIPKSNKQKNLRAHAILARIESRSEEVRDRVRHELATYNKGRHRADSSS